MSKKQADPTRVESSLLSVDGLRKDGRRVHEHREVTAELSAATLGKSNSSPMLAVSASSFHHADGSCHYSCGPSELAVRVFGMREVINRTEARAEAAVVTCDVVVPPFASSRGGASQRGQGGAPAGTQRLLISTSSAVGSKRSFHQVQQEEVRAAGGKSAPEMEQFIIDLVSDVVLLSQFPSSRCHIEIIVLSEQSASPAVHRAACANATMLALADANVPMVDLALSVAVAVVDRHAVVDPAWHEAKGTAGTPIVFLSFLAHQCMAHRSARIAQPPVLRSAFEGASKLTLEDLEAMVDAGARAVAEILAPAAVQLLKAQTAQRAARPFEVTR